MKNKTLTIIALLLINIAAYAQQTEQPQTFGLTLSGYIKTDVFYDTRQTVGGREGEFELYPASKSLDANGTDIKAIGDFNILSIQSRLTGKITAPDVLGAKSTGVFEGEFFGTAASGVSSSNAVLNNDVNGFRLRLGYVNLNWDNSTQILIGQAWHPLFILDAAPATISYNTGTPFKTLSRNPQIKLSQALNSNINVSLAFITERDFQSCGPAGSVASATTYSFDTTNRTIKTTTTKNTDYTSTASTTYAQDAIIPNTDLQIAFRNDNFLFALTGDYKIIEPLQSVTKNNVVVKTTETISSVIGQVTAKYKTTDFSVTVEGIYAQDPTSQFLIGGYAVKSINATTGIPTFTNFTTGSFWTDIIYGSQLQVALFAGYTENLGTSDNIDASAYSSIKSINYVYGYGVSAGKDGSIKDIIRLSPRVVLNYGKTRFGLELEYTSAAYGTSDATNKGKVINTYNESNIRVLFGAYIFF
jgi:hypothetical protein